MMRFLNFLQFLKERVFAISSIYKMFQKFANGDLKTVLASDYICSNSTFKVLDIGCGPAVILDHIPYKQYVGIDSNPKYIEAAKESYPENTNFICTNIAKLDELKLGEFDRILILGVIHHLSDDEVNLMLAQLKRNMQVNGILVTCDPALESNQHPIARFLARNDRGRFVRSSEQYLNLLSPYFLVEQQKVHHDLLRVPNTQFVTVSRARS